MDERLAKLEADNAKLLTTLRGYQGDIRSLNRVVDAKFERQAAPLATWMLPLPVEAQNKLRLYHVKDPRYIPKRTLKAMGVDRATLRQWVRVWTVEVWCAAAHYGANRALVASISSIGRTVDATRPVAAHGDDEYQGDIRSLNRVVSTPPDTSSFIPAATAMADASEQQQRLKAAEADGAAIRDEIYAVRSRIRTAQFRTYWFWNQSAIAQAPWMVALPEDAQCKLRFHRVKDPRTVTKRTLKAMGIARNTLRQWVDAATRPHAEWLHRDGYGDDLACWYEAQRQLFG